MDHHYFAALTEASDSSSSATAAAAGSSEPASTPLPPVALPTFPSPSVSPGASKYHTRRYSQQYISKPSSATPNTASPTLAGSAFSVGAQTMSSDESHQAAVDAALEEEIERSRQERLKRRTLTSNTMSDTSDPRDSASARENIVALASRGAQPTPGASGAAAPPSLASFMGGGAKPPPRHRVGTGMTEQEKEETDRLEKEMEAARSKWKASASDSPVGGVSLASLMKGNKADESDVKVGVAQRWGKTIEREGLGTGSARISTNESNDSTSAASGRSPTSSSSAGGGPTSLAAMMGSKASGPRLNQPKPQASNEEGPAHARRGFAGAHALPGMVAAGSVRTRAQSISNDQAPASSSPSAVSTSPVQTKSSVFESTPKSVSPIDTQGGFTPRSDASKRSSVMDRWGRDRPNEPDTSPRPRSPLNSRPSSPIKQTSTPLPATAAAPSSPAVNRGWSGPPIGVKDTSKPSAWSAPIKADAPAEPKYTRGVALPGMGMGAPAASPSAPSASSRPSSPTSVRNVIAQWGSQSQASQTAAALAALSVKESYGVKVASPRTSPKLSSRVVPSTQIEPNRPKQPPQQAPPQSAPSYQSSSGTKSSPAPLTTLAPEPAAATSTKPPPASARATAPAMTSDLPLPQSLQEKRNSLTQIPKSKADTKAVQATIALALNTPAPSRLPPGTVEPTDVYSLLTNDPGPIDHNHVLYRTEILAIVHRQSSPDSTTVFVWEGDEAPQASDKVENKIKEIVKKEGAKEVHRITYRQETSALGEVFGGQITICRGLRDDFDHLATRLYSVQAYDDVIYVEEQELTAKSICSGHCTVFSIVGEVYAWMGIASTAPEQEACFEFAESIADGRHVSILSEGSETAYFWHGLDGLEYASAHYWRFRPLVALPISVIAFESTSSIRRVEPIDVPTHCVSLVDGGFAEHWVVVPASCKGKKAELDVALTAAEELASRWKERGFGFKQAVHVLCAPSKIPVDLPHLARQLDFTKLNGSEEPSKMNVFTAEEARAQLL